MNYLARLTKLRQRLYSIPCDALLIEHPTHLLYLTGLELSAGRLLISQQDAALMVDGRYIEVARKCSPYPVYPLEEKSYKDWLASQAIEQLGFESEKVSHQAFLSLQKTMVEWQKEGIKINLVPVDSLVQQLRWIKDEDEIHLLRQAAHLGYSGYEFILAHLKEGITEAELAFELEFFWKKKGAKKLAFEPIIAFGANSSMPHYRAGPTTLVKGMAVLIDIGVVWQHYHSDMTRVTFFGEPDPRIRNIYTVVEEAKNRALALCKPGTLIGALDREARQHISEKGYGDYFTHSLGHGLGLDIHESPTLRSKGSFSEIPLQAGMVITIEPGIYLPGIGGVRLEDTILITNTGYENLTISNSKQLKSE